MPTSAFQGRSFFTHHLSRVAEDLVVVVDFGPGEGTYSILGRHLAPDADWVGVEVFAPYVQKYDLMQKYDSIMIGDLRDVQINCYSLGIFGDVLEHLAEHDARKVLEEHAAKADHLYVSVPIIPAPQGPINGNRAEKHLHDWTFESMSELLLSLSPKSWDAWKGHTVGRWWLDL